MATSMLVVLAAAGLVAGAPAQNTAVRSSAAVPVAAKAQLTNVAVKRNLGATCIVSQKTKAGKAAAARCTEAQQGQVASVGTHIVSNTALSSFLAPLAGATAGSLIATQVIDNGNGTSTVVISAR